MRSFGTPTTEAGIAFWNAQLATRAKSFKASKSGSEVILSDTAKPWNTVINNPKAFGAKDDICVVCEGTPDQVCGVVPDQKCIWYNTYHPGTAIHKEIAKQVAKDIKGWL